MVLGTSSFFYFFQLLNNWPRVLMFIWDYSFSSAASHIDVEVQPLSSTLDLDNSRQINSPLDFEQFYGLVRVSACNFSAPRNVTYHWQQFFDGSRLSSSETNTCFTTLRCVKEGVYTIQLSVTTSQGKVIRAGSKNFASHPKWLAIIGDSFASGEGNPDVRRTSSHKAKWLSERCHRSGKSFAAQVFEQMHKKEKQLYLTFLACAGATVENGILKAKGESSQLETLESIATMRFKCPHCRGRGPNIVILTTGGNDIGFSDIINSVVHDSSRINISLMDMRFFFVSHLLDNVADHLRSLGAENVFVPQYFDFTKNQFGEIDASCIASRELSTSTMAFAERGILRRLNQLLHKKGLQNGWHVASTVPAIFAQKGICSSQSFIRNREESLALQGDASGAFHPNEEGHVAVAKEMLDLLRNSGVLQQLD